MVVMERKQKKLMRWKKTMSKGKSKWKLEKKFDCPQCGARLEIKWKEETITPAIPADKEEVFEVSKDEVSKDTQTSLDKITETHKKDKAETKKQVKAKKK
jgi:hypothetical protein